MSEIQKDKEVALDRKNPLKDDESKDLKVTASLRDQQLDKLYKKLEDLNLSEKIYSTWLRAQSDRSEWLERQTKYLQEVDEFIEPIYPQALEWSSTLHLPTILTICKTYSARMYAALMGVDPPFTVRSRTSANVDRALLIEELMRYTLRDWTNEHEGVEEAVERWIWEWVTKGDGILKTRWHKKFTRYMDVETTEVEDVEMQVDPQTGNSVPQPVTRQVEKEVNKTEMVFEGPMLECVPSEDVVIVGGDGDPKKADYILQQSWMTASELWSLVDQKLFRADAVEKVINSGRDYKLGPDQTGDIKRQASVQAGEGSVDKYHEIDRYKILECYLKVDVDGSGIASDIIVWMHPTSKSILRTTYLRRVMPTGQVPFHKISFHKRYGVQHSVGLVELLYSLGKEIDAMHNMKVDIGILSSMPIGFYRPTASALKEERLPIEPGALIPVDNPQTDIYFPNMGNRTAFGMQEEAALMQQVERLTSISDINLGIIGGQGASRTATGTRALLGESSNNLSIYIQRMNRGWKSALKYIFSMLQYRLPPGFQFRVLGDDGDAYWREIRSREELEGMFDFELEANSANSNKQIQIEQAQMLYQLTGNPMDLQLGIITPAERYEAISHMLKVNGVKDVSKYIRKPQGAVRQFTPIEMVDRILAGMDVQFTPTEDLQGFLDIVQHIMEDDHLLGQFSQHDTALLKAKAHEAAGLLASLQQQQQQQLATQQQQNNAMATQMPGNMQQPSITQAPPPGEGG